MTKNVHRYAVRRIKIDRFVIRLINECVRKN